jgi:DnaJ-class molecular chaperone
MMLLNREYVMAHPQKAPSQSPNSPETSIQKPCPVCRHSGEVDGAQCRTCNGTGEIENNPEKKLSRLILKCG